MDAAGQPARPLRVLVACEYSGRVREARRALGHDAWSCDLLPAEDSSPYHVQGDCLCLLDNGAPGGGAWDVLIAHPPCTYLTNAGVRWLYGPDGARNEPRWRDMADAAAFFMRLWLAPNVDFVCLENPVPHRHAGLPRFTQSIQPYQFGHHETKRTCLWLRGLPPLRPTQDVKAATMALPYAARAKVHFAPPGAGRWKERSRTYQGIAAAMAAQWAPHVAQTMEGRAALAKVLTAEALAQVDLNGVMED